jgi:hypothetical protein
MALYASRFDDWVGVRFRVGFTLALIPANCNGNATVVQRLPEFRSARELLDYCA